MTYLFVYGTLMTGLENHYYIEKDVFLGEATTVCSHTLYVGIDDDLPYLSAEGSEYVTGELYKVSHKTLRRMDILEGHPSWYKRGTVLVSRDGSEIIRAQAYYATPPDDSVVAVGGSYKYHIGFV